MPTLATGQVRHIALLARLELSDEEVEKYTRELTSILEFIGKLQEVDTGNMEATAHVTGLSNALRDDVVQPSEVSADALLECSPLPIVDHQIQTLSAHG